LLPTLAKGAAGMGFKRASVRVAAALRALSAEDVFCMGACAGNNSTVSAIRSAAVLVM
jgi:hypothetical protein